MFAPRLRVALLPDAPQPDGLELPRQLGQSLPAFRLKTRPREWQHVFHGLVA